MAEDLCGFPTSPSSALYPFLSDSSSPSGDFTGKLLSSVCDLVKLSIVLIVLNEYLCLYF